MQKSKLIEKIAELIIEKKLPILADVRDESAEDIRIVLEPKNRTIDENMLMESLFKMSELEVRISLNLNVLDRNHSPHVMSLREALEHFLDHRIEVLVRRSRFRLNKIEHRMEVLGGYLVAFLNLDEVIRIIREEDDAKFELMAIFKLTDVQAEAILNMRLRSLRRLEEMELKGEHDKLGAEREGVLALLDSTEKQWDVIAEDLTELKKAYGPKTDLGARRSDLEDAPQVEAVPIEAMIEKEPITVICSKMGWVRAMKGHIAPDEEVKYKEGDEGEFRFHAQTTDKLLLLGSNGKCYTIGADKLPGGRGNGEPIRLMLDMDSNEELVTFFSFVPGEKRVLASSAGKGFITIADNMVASTRGGKQVMNVKAPIKAKICSPIMGDSVAVLGENRKLLVFGVDELPEMTRGQGVKLQNYKQAGMSDLKTFNRADGLTWTMGGAEGRTRTETDLLMWEGKRAGAGRLVPRGFPNRKTFD